MGDVILVNVRKNGLIIRKEKHKVYRIGGYRYIVFQGRNYIVSPDNIVTVEEE